MTHRRAPAWLTEWEYAHRGLHGDGIPENSLAGAEAAIARGMGIECDVQRSFDDQAIVFHDWELDRLTGEPGFVEDRIAADLERYRLQGSDQAPISLVKYLAALRDRVPVLIEIKSKPDYDVEWTCLKVAEALADYSGEHAVMSFDPRVPAWLAANAPDIVRGLVGTDTLDNGFRYLWRKPGSIEQAQPDFLAIDVRDLPHDRSDQWRENGGPLLTWTVRTGDLRDHALQNADALISEGEGLA